MATVRYANELLTNLGAAATSFTSAVKAYQKADALAGEAKQDEREQALTKARAFVVQATVDMREAVGQTELYFNELDLVSEIASVAHILGVVFDRTREYRDARDLAQQQGCAHDAATSEAYNTLTSSTSSFRQALEKIRLVRADIEKLRANLPSVAGRSLAHFDPSILDSYDRLVGVSHWLVNTRSGHDIHGAFDTHWPAMQEPLRSLRETLHTAVGLPTSTVPQDYQDALSNVRIRRKAFDFACLDRWRYGQVRYGFNYLITPMWNPKEYRHHWMNAYKTASSIIALGTGEHSTPYRDDPNRWPSLETRCADIRDQSDVAIVEQTGSFPQYAELVPYLADPNSDSPSYDAWKIDDILRPAPAPPIEPDVKTEMFASVLYPSGGTGRLEIASDGVTLARESDGALKVQIAATSGDGDPRTTHVITLWLDTQTATASVQRISHQWGDGVVTHATELGAPINPQYHAEVRVDEAASQLVIDIKQSAFLYSSETKEVRSLIVGTLRIKRSVIPS